MSKPQQSTQGDGKRYSAGGMEVRQELDNKLELSILAEELAD